MPSTPPTITALTVLALLPAAQARDLTIRVATMNVADLRTMDLLADAQPRVERIAEVIQRLRANILLINEIAYDRPDAPDWLEHATLPGQNARRLVDRFLKTPQAEGLQPITMHAWMPEVNTGEPSGHDLDRSGEAVTAWPKPDAAEQDGSSPRQTDQQRAYGNDARGFGTFPGQYGMALLVDSRFQILHEDVRTYRLFKWADIPDSHAPVADDGAPWYTPDAWSQFRLSSKTLADVPVLLPNGEILHCVISHPTPPAFDGPENRNKLRNRGEIRLLRAFLDNEAWLVDDQGKPGGLVPGSHVIVLGDLNADPSDGSSLGDPIAHLLGSPALGPDPAPMSEIAWDTLDPSDTALFGLRVDYVLPGGTLPVVRTGVWRHHLTGDGAPMSDHFPVWAEIIVPDTKPE